MANATAYASRANGGADFIVGPFSSSLTRYAAMQASAEDKVLMAPAAAVHEVIASSNLTFGTMPYPKECAKC